MKDVSIKFFQDLVSGMGVSGDTAVWIEFLLMFAGLALVTFAMWWVTKRILMGIIISFAAKSKTTFWNFSSIDALVIYGLFP